MRISAFTQPMDLLPTIAALMGMLEPSSSASTKNGGRLECLWLGASESIRDVIASGVQSEAGFAHGIRSRDWYLIASDSVPSKLYVKPDDRWEVNDLRQHHEEVVEALERSLRAVV